MFELIFRLFLHFLKPFLILPTNKTKQKILLIRFLCTSFRYINVCFMLSVCLKKNSIRSSKQNYVLRSYTRVNTRISQLKLYTGIICVINQYPYCVRYLAKCLYEHICLLDRLLVCFKFCDIISSYKCQNHVDTIAKNSWLILLFTSLTLCIDGSCVLVVLLLKVHRVRRHSKYKS